jgi:ribonuclease E
LNEAESEEADREAAEPAQRREPAPRREPASRREPAAPPPLQEESAPRWEPVPPPAQQSEPAPQPVVLRHESPLERAIEPAPMAMAELLPIVESSGMKLAQTDPAKLAAAQARAAALQPAPARIGRERPVLAPVEEAPLTQVETRGQP